MKSKSFDDYQEACTFNDKVDGQIQWCTSRTRIRPVKKVQWRDSTAYCAGLSQRDAGLRTIH